MYHDEFPPNKNLKSYIRSYFFIRVESGKFHFPADGCPGLIINLGDPFLFGFEKGNLARFVGCRLFGSSTRNLLAEHMTGRIDLLAVKFNPGQMLRFFNVPAIELTDTSASIHTLLGKFGREMERNISQTRDISKIINFLDIFFMRLLSHQNAFDVRITAALNAILHYKGQLRIEKLARQLQVSRRHLERLFSDYIGLTPKRTCRIIRLLGVFSSMQASLNGDWADFAIGSGFSDQAHLIRECKFFTGHSPLSYLKVRSSLENAVLGSAYLMSHFFNT